jgi:hypothetical protein
MTAALMLALDIAGRDQEVLSRARQMVEEYLRGSSTTAHATLLDALVRLAALAGDRQLYEAYLDRSRTAESRGEVQIPERARRVPRPDAAAAHARLRIVR